MNEDEIALQRAIHETDGPDFMSEIIRFERLQQAATEPVTTKAPLDVSSDSNQDDIQMESLQDDMLDLQLDLEEAGAIGHDERIPLAHRLNEDIFYHILLFLDEDTIAECICTCKSWRILRSERLFKHLCHRIYSVQSRKHPSALKLKNFRCWYDMFVHRPRVRYNGFYLLRVAYCKTPERSMFTDLPAGAILETVYYRYFEFKRDGTVRYCMDHRSPEIVKHWFYREDHARVFEGTFLVERDLVQVRVETSHAIIEFHFHLHSNGRGHGVNLSLILHSSQSLTAPHRTPCIHETHDEQFQFYRI